MVVAVALVLGPVAHAHGPVGPAELDPAFADAGVFRLDLPGDDFPRHMTSDATGTSAVSIDVGDAVTLAVVTPEGRLDAGFAGAGLRSFRFGSQTYSAGLGRARDGDVLLATWSHAADMTQGSRLAITKVRPDGSLDTSFGQDGTATTRLGELTPVDHGPAAFAVAPDGSIYVVGIDGAGSWYGGAWVAVLLRFNPDGSRDTSFGTGGLVLVSPALPVIGALTVDRQGRILVGETGLSAAPWDVLVRRFLPTGLPDPSFGAGGVAHVDFGGRWISLAGLHVDRQGRILCYGDSLPEFADSLMAAAEGAYQESWSPYAVRLNDAGSPDPTFGSGGGAVAHTDAAGRRLLWAGASALSETGLLGTALLEEAGGLANTMIRIDDAGRVDRSFGSPGGLDLGMDNAMAVSVTGKRVVVLGERTRESGGTMLAAYRR